MKILVTGADGFVGKHLIRELIARGHFVFAGLKIEASQENVSPLATLASPVGAAISASQLQTVEIDLTSSDALRRLFRKTEPDCIIHLAALSRITTAWEEPSTVVEVNTVGTVRLVEAAYAANPDLKIVTVGSSEEYGLAGKSGEQLTEDSPCFPRNPYASSKLAAGQLAMQLAAKYKMRICHLRPFNHFGPGQLTGFVVSDFASQIAKIEKGLMPPVMRVGELSAQRDFTDVRDIVKAYSLLLGNDIPAGVYNICSETTRSARDILDLLLAMTPAAIAVEQDPDRLRPNNVPVFRGSAAKIRRATGWHPEKDFAASLNETLEWWRQNLN